MADSCLPQLVSRGHTTIFPKSPKVTVVPLARSHCNDSDFRHNRVNPPLHIHPILNVTMCLDLVRKGLVPALLERLVLDISSLGLDFAILATRLFCGPRP